MNWNMIAMLAIQQKYTLFKKVRIVYKNVLDHIYDWILHERLVTSSIYNFNVPSKYNLVPL